MLLSVSPSSTVQQATQLVGIAPEAADAEGVLFLPDGAGDSSSTASKSSSLPAVPLSTIPANPVSIIIPLLSSSTEDSTPSATATPVSAIAPPALVGPIVAAYYPDWASSVITPEQIDYSRFDWIDFAFAVPTSSFGLTWDDPKAAPNLLSRLVTAAHAKGTKVKLSVGGWDGSQFVPQDAKISQSIFLNSWTLFRYFSSACATAPARKTFVNNIVSVYTQYHLDGIDIDWEFPGQQGEGHNVVSPQDSANFLMFLQLLRSSLPGMARISAAVQTVPFADASGNPMTDVSGFASVLDWVLIMNYDTWGCEAHYSVLAPLADCPSMHSVVDTGA